MQVVRAALTFDVRAVARATDRRSRAGRAGADYVELAGANHWLPEQNVDEVAPLLLRHLPANPAPDA